MTIREIEEQLGIPGPQCATMSGRGFSPPPGAGNNYRDYTQEDLDTLEKICLLRQLDMPLDTIKAVQRGEVPLRGGPGASGEAAGGWGGAPAPGYGAVPQSPPGQCYLSGPGGGTVSGGPCPAG